jgi:predicted regulator of Ras-like GTPase activity (Roadblock/LC7/MglB family)
MTPFVWTWLLSLTGAALFFAAGAAFMALRRTRLAFPRSTEASLPSSAAPIEDTSSRPPIAPLEAALREAHERCAAVERELTQRTAERQQLFRELEIERSARLTQHDRASPSAPGLTNLTVAGLTQELAFARELLGRRDAQIEELRQTTAQLRSVEGELAQAKREISALNEHNRLLRAQAFTSKPPAQRPRNPTPTLSATGRTLQTIVDTETRLGRAKSAVIADELGLLVAASSTSNASSEYYDALAALGAYLAEVGTRTQDILPLRNLSQVIVRDDHDVTLTVRPLATDDPGLALVTLAVEPMSSANDNRHN